MTRFDAVVVGAGFSGATVAERLADQGDRVLVIDQRAHVAGNCHDAPDVDGVYVHRYGPHIFHTDRPEVWQYLSRFTNWLPYRHRVRAEIDGCLVPLPFNLDALHQLLPAARAQVIEARLLAHYGEGASVPVLDLRESADPELRALGEFVYARVFANYSRKQWGIDPARLDPQVTGRVPVRLSRDDGYFQDPWQGIPDRGYANLVSRMLAHPNIELRLSTPMSEVLAIDLATGARTLLGASFAGPVVYTGMIDALFGYCFGRLPYRSLRFEVERVTGAQRLPVAVVNHPDHPEMTRITDFGHFMGRGAGAGTQMREYPKAYDGESDPGMPFYPVFSTANQACFERYREAAARLPDFHALGRLAQYKYYDMDDAVAAALALFEQRLKRPQSGQRQVSEE